MTDTLDFAFAEPYAVLPVSLAKRLYSNDDFKQLTFAIYIDSKRKCKEGKWDFNTADITHETGIDRRLVSSLCQAFVDAGILSASGRTPKGARKYQVNHRKFERYLTGKLAVKSEDLVCMGCCAHNEHQSQEQPVKSGTPERASQEPAASRCSLNAEMVFIPCTSGVHSMDTKISEKISEEDKRPSNQPTSNREPLKVSATKDHLRELFNKHYSNGGKEGESPAEGKTITPSALSAGTATAPALVVAPDCSTLSTESPLNGKEGR